MILFSVGPGPGALSAPEVSRELAGAGHRVEVVLEPGTTDFVGPAAFAGSADVVRAPTGPPDATLFAPATAATLARLARGLALGMGEETVSCVAGARPGVRPAVVAPGLDAATARHPAVRENLGLLRGDGFVVLGGDGDPGVASAGELVAEVLRGLGGPLGGHRLLVTAGGTREPIDSVRFIGNRSSGKMGTAMAREAVRLGAEVTLVAANVDATEPGVVWVPVETVEELRDEIMDRAGDADALVMAAAVSDFMPASPVQEKIRRREGLSLELKPTEDVLGAVRERYPGLFVVGFAATHGDPLADAREKLGSKGTNLVVGNDISRSGMGFAADENEVYVVGRHEESFVPRASKGEVARAILDVLAKEMREERRG